jgi:hypothetical protein
MTCAALGERPCHEDSNAAYESRERILGEASCTMLCYRLITSTMNLCFLIIFLINQFLFDLVTNFLIIFFLDFSP